MEKKHDLRIVFMGTPEFAVASLDALISNGVNIVGVITAPDKPAGRGMKINESAVKKYAQQKGLRILQPEKLKNPEFIEELKSLRANMQVVVAFRMLPDLVWNMPMLGTVNVHASLLPQYRGAAPINWAIINGEKETGVTTFKLQHAIDTGNILLQEKTPIGENETAGELHDRLKIIGAQLLVKTVEGIASHSISELSQASLNQQQLADLKHAPKIFTETCNINWKESTENVHNLIRGLSPFPGAFTSFQGKIIKVFRSHKEDISESNLTSLQPGEWFTDKKSFLKFACLNGFIHLEEVQLEGKKKLHIADFLRGYHFK